MIEDYSFLRPVFWRFWQNELAKLEPLNPNRWDHIGITKQLEAFGFRFGWEVFREQYQGMFECLSQQQLALIGQMLTHTVQHGRYEFIIRKKVDIEALEWTYIQVVGLELPGLDLFAPLNANYTDKTKPEAKIELQVLPYKQCLQCGKPLRESKSGATLKFCHWSECKTANRSTYYHVDDSNKHCCWARHDLLTRNRRSKIIKAQNAEQAIATFESLLKSIYQWNLQNSDNLYPITPKFPNIGIGIHEIAEVNKPKL